MAPCIIPTCLKILLISPTTGHSAMLCSHPHLRRPCPGAASAPSLLCLYLKQHCMAILVLSIRDSALHDFRWFLQLTQYIQYMCLIVYIYIYSMYIVASPETFVCYAYVHMPRIYKAKECTVPHYTKHSKGYTNCRISFQSWNWCPSNLQRQFV